MRFLKTAAAFAPALTASVVVGLGLGPAIGSPATGQGLVFGLFFVVVFGWRVGDLLRR